MFDGVIIDGVSGTGKSTLFKRYQETPSFRRVESRLVLAQAYTLRMAREERPERLLDELLRDLEAKRSFYRHSEFASRSDGRGSFRFLFEGFHHHFAFDRIPERRRRAFVAAVDERLRAVGAKVVGLYVPDGHMQETVRSTLASRGDKWRQYVRRYGATEEEIADFYRRRQDEFLEMLAGSRLPTLLVDTCERQWTDIVERIESFVDGEASGANGRTFGADLTGERRAQ